VPRSCLPFAVRFLGTAAVLISRLAYAGDYKPPAPTADFPSLDSYYPPAAVRAGQQGTATMHICVDIHGQLTEPPTIAESSGNDVLDAGAMNLANAGNGHYRPATQNGSPVSGCGGFRIAFKMRGSSYALPVNDPRFPTIGARIEKLNAEFKRRFEARLDPGNPEHITGMIVDSGRGGAGAEAAIREYSRTYASFISELVGMEADFLNDIDYLQESPDIPETEREVFRSVWPENRQGIVVNFREMVASLRDLERVSDEMGDFMAFSAPRRLSTGESVKTGGADESHAPPPEDPQITALKQRAQAAIERMQKAMQSR
jgi:TonB family protein